MTQFYLDGCMIIITSIFFVEEIEKQESTTDDLRCKFPAN